ncbi:MAG: RNA-binding domain-containing protein [Nanopusillaceae archaeon]
MKISKIYLRVNIHEWDDKNKVEQAINLLLKDIDRKKIKIKYSEGKGLISNKIYVYEIEIDKKDLIEKFFKNLIELGLDYKEIEKNGNFDERYNLYLRIDKTELLVKNKIKIFYSDDSFLLKISFDGYKKDKEKVLNFLKEYIGRYQ